MHDWTKVNAILEKVAGRPTPTRAGIAAKILAFQVSEAARIYFMQGRVSEWLNRAYENER
jgi:hypothetical protein